MTADLAVILNREFHLQNDSAIVGDPGAVIDMVRSNLPDIIETAGDALDTLCLVLLRGSLARRECGAYSDIDIEAFSLQDFSVVDRILHVENYLVTYYRSSFLEIEKDLATSALAMWHQGGLRDSIVLEDKGQFWSRLLNALDTTPSSHRSPSLSVYLPPLRRFLEYRRKIYNCSRTDTIFFRYCAHQAAYNFIAFWYAATLTKITSEATFYESALSRLPQLQRDAVYDCLDSTQERVAVIAAVDHMITHALTLLPGGH